MNVMKSVNGWGWAVGTAVTMVALYFSHGAWASVEFFGASVVFKSGMNPHQ
jgi:hypothetical protein